MADPRIEMIAVESDRRLRCALYGEADAQRVLVFDPGSFGIYVDGHHLGEELARRGWFAVLGTRAGMYGSDPLPAGQAPTPGFHVSDLSRLMEALKLGERRPVLAGHSMAGVRVHLAGCTYPEKLRGLALLDAVCPSLMGGMRWSGWVAWATGLGEAGAMVAGTPIGNLVENLHPNYLKLEGQLRSDKLSSINSESHLKTAGEEVAVTTSRMMTEPVEPALSLPAFFATATPISQGTSELVEAYERAGTWAERLHLKKDGHMSMLTPPSVRLLADGIERLWEAGA